MRNEEVVIQSQRVNEDLLELIPRGKIEADFPASLVNDHVHWLNLSTRAIDFRPVKTMWAPSNDNWVLQFTEGGQSVAQRGQSALFDIRSPTFLMIARTLRPLEDFRYLEVTRDSDAGQMVVKVNLPLYGLSFFIDSEGELQSHDQRGMVVDENQSTGTMLGLVSQLVVRPKDRQTYDDRRVIIPQGDVVVKPSGHHVQVIIHPGPGRRHYHWYTVDAELCRLTGNVGLTNKLYKVYLHAVCSAHVPDPLTKRTGVEEAMFLLQSAACYSFMKLDPFDSQLLTQIGSLTVDRTWYPADKRSMQRVHWQDGLSSYVQSCAFYHAARNIVQYATKLQVLSEAPVEVCPDFPAREEFLLEHVSQRSTVLYSRDIVDFFYPTRSSTTEYTARDLVRCSDDEQRAFECASMVRDWSNMLEPCQSLYEVFLQWNRVPGGNTRVVSLRYDREWLKPNLGERWMSVYELCRGTYQETHTFELAFTLSAMTYSSPENMKLAVTMFAFAAIPDFREIRSPCYDMYDLSFGLKPPERDLCRLISSSTTFENSPEASLSPRSYEGYYELDTRRRNEFQSECLREQTAAVNILLDWPPCDSIPRRALDVLNGCRYNKSNLTAELDNLYTNCYRNHCLKGYLDNVQNVLDEARRTFTPSVKQTYAFTPSNSSVVSVTTIVPTGDLFRKQPPVIALLSEPLKQSCGSDKFSRGVVDPTPLRDVISTFSRCRSDRFGHQYSAHLEESRSHLEDERSPTPPRPTRCEHILQRYKTRFGLYSNAILGLGRRYSAHLEESRSHLECERSPTSPHSTRCADILQHYQTWCGLYSNALLSLEEHLAPCGLTEESLFNSGQLPRITVTFLLGLLASTSKTPLCDAWKASLTNFTLILLRLQRLRRLLRLAAGGDHQEFLKELANDGYQGVENTQAYVDWLLIQVFDDHQRSNNRSLTIALGREPISYPSHAS
jgi:hypothetical protein